MAGGRAGAGADLSAADGADSADGARDADDLHLLPVHRCGVHHHAPALVRLWFPLLVGTSLVLQLGVSALLDVGRPWWPVAIVVLLGAVALYALVLRRATTALEPWGVRWSDGLKRPRTVDWDDVAEVRLPPPVAGARRAPTGPGTLVLRDGGELRLDGVPRPVAEDLARWLRR